MSGSRDHGRQHVRFRFNKQFARMHLRSFPPSLSLFRNFRIAIRYCQSWNGRKTVGQRDTRARARAFEIGGLLYIASKRVCNVVVVRVIQAFRIAVQRKHFLSSLVQSFHSRTNLNNTKRSIVYTRIILSVLLFRLKSFYLRIASRDGEM